MSAAFVFAGDYLQGLEGCANGVCLSALSSCNSNLELVNNHLIFKPIADTICHSLLKL